jgi:hypothetical protein
MPTHVTTAGTAIVAGAADHIGERVEQPDEDRAREDHVRVGQRRIEREAAPAHRGIERAAAGEHAVCEYKAEDRRDDERMQRQGIGVRAPPGAERARDRRRDAAAHGARRHHLHQHQRGEYQGHAGKGGGPEPADEIGLDHSDRRLRHHHQHVGRGKTQQRSRERRLEQTARARILRRGGPAWGQGSFGTRHRCVRGHDELPGWLRD